MLEHGCTIDRPTILALNKKLQRDGDKSLDFNVTPSASEHIVYALPHRYGTPVFSVGGWVGGFYLHDTFMLENGSEYSELYDIWLSDEVDLGYTSVNVK